jgi:protein-tyrosine-phosphatase
MAEGFANAYGRDVLHAESSGLGPATSIAPETVQTMEEKNINISAHIPRQFDVNDTDRFDLVVNLSGFSLPEAVNVPVRDWQVTDPYRQDAKIYRDVCNELEHRVMRLILELRREANNGRNRT